MSIDLLTTDGQHFEQTGVKTVTVIDWYDCETWYRRQVNAHVPMKRRTQCPGCDECATIREPIRTQPGRIYSLERMLDGIKSLAFIGVYVLRDQSGRVLATETSLEAIKTYASGVHMRNGEIVLKTGIPVMVSIDDDNPVEFYEEEIARDVREAGKYYFRSVYGPEFLVSTVSQELVTKFD